MRPMRLSLSIALSTSGSSPPSPEAARPSPGLSPKARTGSRRGSCQDTTERYFLDGERIPYFFDGRNQTRALFFEYARGLTDRREVKAQLPFFSISFDAPLSPSPPASCGRESRREPMKAAELL